MTQISVQSFGLEWTMKSATYMRLESDSLVSPLSNSLMKDMFDNRVYQQQINLQFLFRESRLGFCEVDKILSNQYYVTCLPAVVLLCARQSHRQDCLAGRCYPRISL